MLAGTQLLQIPGPTNVPRRVLDAIGQPTLDHRGQTFATLMVRSVALLRQVIGTTGAVALFPASGTGAWEAAIVNTLSPGDSVLFCETGYFADRWRHIAEQYGLQSHVVGGDWRRGADVGAIRSALEADSRHEIRAVCVVHNETSTGAVSDISAVRSALDDSGHPALLMVDTISSLASMPYDQTALGVDVTIAASQKGLMLPPGLSFNGIGPKALETHRSAKLPRSYWDWTENLARIDDGMLPYTPASNLVVGLESALSLLVEEETLEKVFARHRRLADLCRTCVEAWGLEFQIIDADQRSDSLTAVRMPEGANADLLRSQVLAAFGVSLGNGLGKLAGKVFRIGHLGDLNETMLFGALGAIEVGLRRMQVPVRGPGLAATIDALASQT